MKKALLLVVLFFVCMPSVSFSDDVFPWEIFIPIFTMNPDNDCDGASDCDANQFCQKSSGDCDGKGLCTIRPDACIDIYSPVCGCDGSTYANSCYAATAGVNINYEGECRFTLCDDGSKVVCEMIPPVCQEYEVLAIQNGCWICVNPQTCLPWGVPECKDDFDCPTGEVCDPCGTSSCPFCDDCVSSCVTATGQ